MKHGFCFVVMLLLLWLSQAQAQTYSRTDIIAYEDNLSLWVVGQPKSSTNVNAGVVESLTVYDPVTALPVQTFAYGKLQQTLAHNADGTLTSVSDARDSGSYNTTVTFSGWKRGIPQLISFPDGNFKSAAVDDQGMIRSVTDEVGAKTCYDFDAMGRLARIIYPSETQAGVCDTSRWNRVDLAFVRINADEHGLPAGHWRSSRYEGNKHINAYFDAMWRPVLEEQLDYGDVAGTLSQVVKRYDADGRLIFQSYPQRGVGSYEDIAQGVRTTYDTLDRVTKVEQDSELGALVTSTAYLPGFQTQTINPRGKVTTVTGYMTWDQPSTDLPLAITHPEGAYTDIVRDTSFGKPRLLVRRDGDYSDAITRSYVYDGHQQLCKSIEPETGATVFQYDDAGNVAWSASGLALPDANNASCDADRNTASVSGRRVDRTYDARNRLASLAFPDGRGDQSWIYEADGLPKGITTYSDCGTCNPVVNGFSYNQRRLLAGESSAQPGWYSWGIGYGYDANGSLSVQTYPTGLSISYAPNALGQATQAGSYATGVSYHPNGAIKQFTYGNGIIHTMTRNARQLPSRVANAGGVLDYEYTYDANANVQNIYDWRDANMHRYLLYDGLDRLTAAGSQMFGLAGGDHWHYFTYNALDNLTSWRHDGIKYWDYFYDSSNRLTNLVDHGSGATLVGLGYDPQGNLDNKNGQDYDFDYGNRLRSAVGKESYRYDGHGRRVEKIKVGGAQQLFQYSQAGQLLFGWKGPTNETTHEYVYLAGSLVATIDHAWPSNATLATKYQHTDALGSPVAVTNESGQVIDRTQHEPYGAAIGKPAYDGVGYTGHVQDGATGLTYMQQRYYDPQVGLFLSVDPINANRKTGGNFNRYWYANNNPYRYTDPDGRETNPVSNRNRIYDSDLRTNRTNPNVGKFGQTRSSNNWNKGNHNGNDIVARKGTPLVAPASGKVTVTKERDNPRGGNVVRVSYTRADGQVVSIGMAHLSRVDVKSGDEVTEGSTQLGLSGDTGNAAGLPTAEEHVHLTVKVGGVLQDPQKWFEGHPAPPALPIVQPQHLVP